MENLTTEQKEVLIHNVAGELSSLYVNYLAERSINASHDYYKKNWAAEYKSRTTQMQNDNSLIVKLNGLNSFYNNTLAETHTNKRKFLFQ